MPLKTPPSDLNQQWDQLVRSCLGDCVHANTPADLFNALNRLKLVLECQAIYTDINE